MTNDHTRLVLVCSACLCASCWHGEFYCQEYLQANTEWKTVGELDALKREHRSHYSKKKIKAVYGQEVIGP